MDFLGDLVGDVLGDVVADKAGKAGKGLRGPNVSTTADTPAFPAPATTTSTAAGELSTRTAPSCPANGSASG